MKKLLALLALVAMVGLAAPAHADPQGPSGGDDAGFLAALQQAGITYPSPAAAIGSAQAVCGCLDNGEAGLEVVHEVKVRNPGFNMEAASQFAVISAKYYCPHHLGHV
ncbi:DUF732 domain-containing protein [Mycobacterium kansasii]|nr:DUF732 domain-containing protein [Mycobacterium kansasii]ARG59961.1 glycine cleavage system P protein [Mycobacterium kansasii]ARG65402.1 glycine cleavage system P protein [Mycobacterium kansasii]ARG73173.1 glycine cleavage system P protein [Mycobacterium kansasii]ARG77823.1 glycine cleavage system P protein [Mycobacterium kansasii]ARG83280.1 glycine cleavage system P protein [Mycobacterium kansasii]